MSGSGCEEGGGKMAGEEEGNTEKVRMGPREKGVVCEEGARRMECKEAR